MSTASKKVRRLQEIYTKIPSIDCKGLCFQSCAAVPVYQIELDRLDQAAKRKLPVLQIDELPLPVLARDGLRDLTCPLLIMRRCSVYEDRPIICRLFGGAEGLQCPHGCLPREKVLSVQEADELRRQIEKL